MSCRCAASPGWWRGQGRLSFSKILGRNADIGWCGAPVYCSKPWTGAKKQKIQKQLQKNDLKNEFKKKKICVKTGATPELSWSVWDSLWPLAVHSPVKAPMSFLPTFWADTWLDTFDIGQIAVIQRDVCWHGAPSYSVEILFKGFQRCKVSQCLLEFCV